MSTVSSNQKFPQAVVFGLKSGAHVIATTIGETDEAILIGYPLEVIYEDAGPESMVMSLIRYLPFSEHFQTLVNKHSIETMTMCSPKINELYAKRKASFEATATPLDDPDSTVVIDRSDEESDDDMGDDEDGYEPVTAPKRTYH